MCDLNLPVAVRLYTASEEASAPQLTLTDYLIYVEQGADIDKEIYDSLQFASSTL